MVKRRTPYKRAQRTASKTVRYLKRHNKYTISRPLQSNVVYRSFTQFNTITSQGTGWQTAPKGVNFHDYTLADCIPPADLTFYKARYFFGNMVNFVVTFYIETTHGFSQVVNSGGAMTDLYTTPVTDTRSFPNMYVAHWNSPLTQSANYITTDTLGRPNFLTNKTFGRLVYGNKVVRQYHTPIAYRSVYNNIAGWDVGSTLDASLPGPPDNEPHGFTWHFPAYNNYNNNSSCIMMYRIDTVFSFKDRKPE